MVKWKFGPRTIDHLDKMPKDAYGFVYKISIVHEGKTKTYYGKKKLISKRKKKFTKREVAAMKNKRLKKWRYEYKEMDWQNYTGSNKHLNALIKKEGITNLQMKKEILCYAYNETELKYKEAKEIICNEALFDEGCFNDGISVRMIGKPKFDKTC
jgi:hypothetical protein